MSCYTTCSSQGSIKTALTARERVLTGVSDDEQLKEMIVVFPCHVDGRALNFQVNQFHRKVISLRSTCTCSARLVLPQEFVQKSQVCSPCRNERISSNTTLAVLIFTFY